MWITFHKIEKRDNLVSKKTGNKYSAYVMEATKKGFGNEPDTPYEKILFDSHSCTIIEHGRKRPNKNIVQYLKKTAEDGDTIIIKNVRSRNGGWDIESMENITKHSSTGASTSYEPLTEDEIAIFEEVQEQEDTMTERSLPWAV